MQYWKGTLNWRIKTDEYFKDIFRRFNIDGRGIIKAKINISSHGHSDHIPVGVFTIAPKISRYSDSFNYTRKRTSFEGFSDPVINEKSGENLFRIEFIAPEIIRSRTSASEGHEFHSTWIYIYKIRKTLGVWELDYSGLFIGDLDYSETKYLREFVNFFDEKLTFIVLPAYGKFSEEGCIEHKIPEEIKNKEDVMKNKVAEIAREFKNQTIKTIAHWHGDKKPDWAEFSIYLVWPLVRNLPKYKKLKERSRH